MEKFKNQRVVNLFEKVSKEQNSAIECRDQFIGPVAVRRIIGNKIKKLEKINAEKRLIEKILKQNASRRA